MKALEAVVIEPKTVVPFRNAACEIEVANSEATKVRATRTMNFPVRREGDVSSLAVILNFGIIHHKKTEISSQK